MRRALAWSAVVVAALAPMQSARAGSASAAAGYTRASPTPSVAATAYQGGAPASPGASAAAPGAPLPAPADGVLKLALLDAVRLSIVNNLDIELERFDPLVAEQNLRAAWGVYDPRVFADGGHNDTQTPTASTIVGSLLLHDQTDHGEGGVKGVLPVIGGSYSVSYGGVSDVTDSRIQVLSPQFTTQFLASLQVPLLRGLLWGDAWTQVRVSQIGLDASRDTFAAKLMDQVALTENSYWALVAAQANTRVAQKSLDTAKALLDQTKAQFEVGVVSKVDVVQAEAGVADRDFRLITADATERNVQDALIDNVLGPYLGPTTRLDVDPTDPPEEMPVREVDPQTATDRALAIRPEVAAAKRDVDSRTVQLRYASNQRLPQLDFVANFSNNGLAGKANPSCITFSNPPSSPCPVPPVIGRQWTDANDNFFTGRAPRSFVLGGVFSIPLGNVTPRADYQTARLELRRSETALHRLEQQIISDIRRAARNLLAAIEGIDAAERAVVAATEQLRAERVRLEYGESTPFDVLLKEQDLVQAEQQKIAAQQVYHNSITQLDRSQGTILARNHIVVEEAAPLR